MKKKTGKPAKKKVTAGKRKACCFGKDSDYCKKLGEKIDLATAYADAASDVWDSASKAHKRCRDKAGADFLTVCATEKKNEARAWKEYELMTKKVDELNEECGKRVVRLKRKLPARRVV